LYGGGCINCGTIKYINLKHYDMLKMPSYGAMRQSKSMRGSRQKDRLFTYKGKTYYGNEPDFNKAYKEARKIKLAKAKEEFKKEFSSKKKKSHKSHKKESFGIGL
jgi:hypothetical protein